MKSNLKIGFDSTFLSPNGGGISHDSKRIFSKLSSCAEVEQVEAQKSFFGIFQKYIYRLLGSKYALAKNYDLLYYSQFHNYRLRSHQAQIIRVHDLFPITNPEWFRFRSRVSFKLAVKNNLKQNSFYLCNSKSTANKFLVQFPTVRKERVYIEECGVDTQDKIPCSSCLACNESYLNNFLNRKLVVAIGTLEPRKNYSFLLKSWERYQSELDSKFTLMLIGNYGWKVNYLRHKLKNPQANIVWLQGICDYRVDQILRMAHAYICTSYNEGFGMPALEAASLGIPLILPRLSVFLDKYTNVFFYEQNNIADLTNILTKLENGIILKPNIRKATSELTNLVLRLESPHDFS